MVWLDGTINSYEFEVTELHITTSTIVKIFGNFASEVLFPAFYIIYIWNITQWGTHHGVVSQKSLHYVFQLRTLSHMHACYKEFVMIFSLLFTVNFFIN